MKLDKKNRRQFLRGTFGALALPLMPSLGTAFDATTESAPRRLICVGTQLGWHKPAFFPTSGDGRLLEPFKEAGVIENLTTISGLDHKGPTGNGHELVYTLYTGQVSRSISLDQYVAPKLGKGARYESLQLCAGEQPFNSPVSLNKQGISLPPILRPSVMFAKLYGGSQVSQKREAYLLDSGRSLLDEVLQEARSLNGHVNHHDRGKLDEYLTSVREVERKLARRRDWMDKPYPKPDPKLQLPDQENIAYSMMLQNEDLMWEMMALAIKSDSCRVLSLTIPLTNGALMLNGKLMSTGYHTLSHHGRKQDRIKDLVAIESAHMAGAARCMKMLKESRDIDGNTFLDNTTILIGSAMADANNHRRNDYPLMIAGGGYKHQGHIECGVRSAFKNEMACDLFVTVLNHLGFEDDMFATNESNLNEALL